MERSGRHPLKADTVALRAKLVSEEKGSAFHPRGVSYTAIYGTCYTVQVRHYFLEAPPVPVLLFFACKLMKAFVEASTASMQTSIASMKWRLP